MQLYLPLASLSEGAARFGGTEGPDLTRYLVVCAGIVLATGLVAFGFRRLVGGVFRARASRRDLRVVDALALGSRQKLCVVRCYDRLFALGVGDREVNVIAELDVVCDEHAEEVPVSAGDRAAFAEALEQVRRTLPRKPVGAKTARAPKKRLGEEVVA